MSPVRMYIQKGNVSSPFLSANTDDFERTADLNRLFVLSEGLSPSLWSVEEPLFPSTV